jgi:hypothetical protein
MSLEPLIIFSSFYTIFRAVAMKIGDTQGPTQTVLKNTVQCSSSHFTGFKTFCALAVISVCISVFLAENPTGRSRMEGVQITESVHTPPTTAS